MAFPGMLISGNWAAFQDLWESAIFCPAVRRRGIRMFRPPLAGIPHLAALILIINMCVALFLVLGLFPAGERRTTTC